MDMHGLKVSDSKEIKCAVLCGGSRYIRFKTASRPKIAVQRGVGGLENQVAIAALAQMALNLAFYRRRELSL
jgi:hypothetical protein